MWVSGGRLVAQQHKTFERFLQRLCVRGSSGFTSRRSLRRYDTARLKWLATATASFSRDRFNCAQYALPQTELREQISVSLFQAKGTQP